jgi:hypothetical protein
MYLENLYTNIYIIYIYFFIYISNLFVIEKSVNVSKDISIATLKNDNLRKFSVRINIISVYFFNIMFTKKYNKLEYSRKNLSICIYKYINVLRYIHRLYYKQNIF